MVSFIMKLLGGIFVVFGVFQVGKVSLDSVYNFVNNSCTVADLYNNSDVARVFCIVNRTEELIYTNSTVDEFNLTVPLSMITPWKILIADSNVTRVIFPRGMSPSVAHLQNVGIEEVHFEENTKLQDFRADHTTLQKIPESVSKLLALDILWVTHSALYSFSFDVLVNTSVSLLYLVANKITTISITDGLVCCSKLEELFLSDNLLKTFDFGVIALMSKLKNLFLENNQLDMIDVNSANSNNKPLAILSDKSSNFCSWRDYYTKNEIWLESDGEDCKPNCTDYFANVLLINLARNDIFKVNFSVFTAMNNLNSLDLSNNQLISLSANELEVPLRLSELYASNNNLSTINFRPFPSLMALHLFNNSIKDLNMSNLPENIDYLNLINNPLDCDLLPHMNRNTSLPLIGPYTEC